MFPESIFLSHEHHAFHLAGGDSAALLIHGFPGTPAEMRAIATSLHASGWSVFAMLLPGFGPEISRLGETKYEDWISAVLTELNFLSSNFRKIIVCGFSMGAALALIASAHRRVNGTVLLAPYWSVSNWLWKLIPWVQRVFPEIKPFRYLNLEKTEVRHGLMNFLPGADLTDPMIRQQLRNYTFPTRIINEIRKVGLSASKSVPSLESPVLVIQGTRDEIVKPSQTKELVDRLPVEVLYKVVDGGHDLPDPEKPAWNTIESSIIEFSLAIQLHTENKRTQ